MLFVAASYGIADARVRKILWSCSAESLAQHDESGQTVRSEAASFVAPGHKCAADEDDNALTSTLSEQNTAAYGVATLPSNAIVFSVCLVPMYRNVVARANCLGAAAQPKSTLEQKVRGRG